MEEPVQTTPVSPNPNPKPQDDRFKLGKREIIFIVIMVLLLGAAALYAWKISQDDKSDAQTINSFAECSAAGNPIMESYPEQCVAGGKTFTNPDQTAPVAPDQNQAAAESFKIPELGVQFTLSPDLAGLYYNIEADKPNIAYFSVEEFKGTDCAADKVSQGALSKLTEAEVDADEGISGLKDTLKQINGYYYMFSGPQAACSEDETTQAKASSVRVSLSQTIQASLSAIQ